MFGVILDEEDEQDDTKYISVKTSYWEKNIQFRKFKTEYVFPLTSQLLYIIGCNSIGCTIVGWKQIQNWRQLDSNPEPLGEHSTIWPNGYLQNL